MAKKKAARTEKDRAPLCKICNTHHWSREAHHLKEQPPKKPRLVK